MVTISNDSYNHLWKTLLLESIAKASWICFIKLIIISLKPFCNMIHTAWLCNREAVGSKIIEIYGVLQTISLRLYIIISSSLIQHLCSTTTIKNPSWQKIVLQFFLISQTNPKNKYNRIFLYIILQIYKFLWKNDEMMHITV